MTQTAPTTPAWYCVRTRTKTEHLVAERLRRLRDVGVFCPRIRYRKPTRRGPVWFTEALFPSYVFARFHIDRDSDIRYTLDVTGLVTFGNRTACVPDSVMERLQAELGNEEVKVFDEPVRPGDAARILEGPFSGIEVVVRRVLPARQRVQILFHFMGRETKVEMPMHSLAHTATPRVLRRDGGTP